MSLTERNVVCAILVFLGLLLALGVCGLLYCIVVEITDVCKGKTKLPREGPR